MRAKNLQFFVHIASVAIHMKQLDIIFMQHNN
jgi:hypothetical protein